MKIVFLIVTLFSMPALAINHSNKCSHIEKTSKGKKVNYIEMEISDPSSPIEGRSQFFNLTVYDFDHSVSFNKPSSSENIVDVNLELEDWYINFHESGVWLLMNSTQLDDGGRLELAFNINGIFGYKGVMRKFDKDDKMTQYKLECDYKMIWR